MLLHTRFTEQKLKPELCAHAQKYLTVHTVNSLV